MRHHPARTAVEHRVVRAETGGHVVGVEDGDLGGAQQAVAAHEDHVRVRDGQDARGPVGRGGDVARQERGQVLAYRHRPDTRPSPTVGDAERLVEVEVRHVGAELARLGQAHERVQVRTVEVHLTSTLVHDRAHVADVALVHTVGRGIRDHQHREVGGVLVRLRLEVVEVDVAVVVALHHDDVHARHHRAGGVGAVGRLGDEADGPSALTPALVVRPHREEAGELTLRTRVGLQRHRVVPGDLAQRGFEVGEQLGVARGLVGGREGVHVGELGPRDRHHLGGRVELHGAGPERDHRAVEREIAVGQLA